MESEARPLAETGQAEEIVFSSGTDLGAGG